jgi:hypothetical protein
MLLSVNDIGAIISNYYHSLLYYVAGSKAVSPGVFWPYQYAIEQNGAPRQFGEIEAWGFCASGI